MGEKKEMFYRFSIDHRPLPDSSSPPTIGRSVWPFHVEIHVVFLCMQHFGLTHERLSKYMQMHFTNLLHQPWCEAEPAAIHCSSGCVLFVILARQFRKEIKLLITCRARRQLCAHCGRRWMRRHAEGLEMPTHTKKWRMHTVQAQETEETGGARTIKSSPKHVLFNCSLVQRKCISSYGRQSRQTQWKEWIEYAVEAWDWLSDCDRSIRNADFNRCLTHDMRRCTYNLTTLRRNLKYLIEFDTLAC